MLFFNIDHIERKLLRETQEASAHFFFGSAAMCELFGYMENADAEKSRAKARIAAENFEMSADSFRKLARNISTNYRQVSDVVREVPFDEIAKGIGIADDFNALKMTTQTLVRGELDTVLKSTANEISELAKRLREFDDRLGKEILDVEYNKAHALINDWRSLVTRGQYVSAICSHAARMPAQASAK